MNNMPNWDPDGYRGVCNERRNVYIGSNVFRKPEASSLSCQIMSLPGTSYTETLNYIFSKTSNYKWLINWKWVPYTIL